MSNQKKKKDKNKKKNGGETSKLIPSDLYNEVTKFVDKNTLLEYMETIQQTNESIIKGKTFIKMFENFLKFFVFLFSFFGKI